MKVKKVIGRRELVEGSRIPWGYGLSYRPFDRDVAVCYPVPLHLIVRWCRDLWFWIVKVGFPGTRSQWENEIVRQTERRYQEAFRWPPYTRG